MVRPRLYPALLALAAGCLGPEPRTALVPADPYSQTPPQPPGTRAAYAPAPLEAAARVDTVGRKLLAANKEIGLRPQFRVIGAPTPEVFHQGTAEVLVTEGLVKLCTTDGQLAAVLSHELGKMVAEREALAGPQTRSPQRLPPMEVRVGNDNVGAMTADQTHLAELGKFERERRRPTNTAPPLPDPQTLARDYLKKAGYSDADLDAVTPHLKGAAENTTFARQLKAKETGAMPKSWTR
jgi:hypothetical protein